VTSTAMNPKEAKTFAVQLAYLQKAQHLQLKVTVRVIRHIFSITAQAARPQR
jgi:hypothetical protein